jgi:hypothetical protein
MCVIYSCRTSWPDANELSAGAARNTDGAGIAWIAPHPKKPNTPMVWWQKGLKDDGEVLDFIKKEDIKPPGLIHFRTATVGGAVPELTHPFPITKDVPLWTAGYANIVLFHNGHIMDWEDLALRAALNQPGSFPEGVWSDTRALAWLVHLKGAGILRFVLKESRVALFTADGVIRELGNWIEGDGYSQSIATFSLKASTSTGVIHEQPWTSRYGHVTPKGKSQVVSLDNTWSLEELAELLATLEEEQLLDQRHLGRQ